MPEDTLVVLLRLKSVVKRIRAKYGRNPWSFGGRSCSGMLREIDAEIAKAKEVDGESDA